ALLFSFISYSQSGTFTVSGKVLEQSSGAPLEFATVSLTKTGTDELVNGGITDFDGNFALSVPGGTYDIKIEFISFKSITLSGRPVTEDIELAPVSLEMD